MVAAEDLYNLYPEALEIPSGAAKASLIFYGTPGLKTFCTLPDGPMRGLFFQDGRAFAVSGGFFYELFTDATYQRRGIITRDADAPASIVSNGVQLMIASGVDGNGWVYDLATNQLAKIQGTFLKSTQAAFLDGYFIALQPDSRIFQISGLYDGVNWSGLDFAVKEGTSENIVGIIVDHRRLWLFGSKESEVFWNSGNPLFPFERIDGAAMQCGLAAQFSLAALDNAIFWLDKDERGQGIARRAVGYTPQRISTHAVEFAWSQYSKISDAIGWAYQDQGHAFYVLTFPTGDATWVYDVATQMWHQRAWLDPLMGFQHAIRGRCYALAFGKHLVGDRETGKVYEQNINYFDDAGNPIRRQRTGPCVQLENKWTFFHSLELLSQQGTTPGNDGQGDPPKYNLSLSNDGGQTWGADIEATGAKLGKYSQRVLWRRLGRARQRAFRVWSSDPIRHAWIDCYLELSAGNGA